MQGLNSPVICFIIINNIKMKRKAIVELWNDGTFSIFVPDMEKHNLNAQGKTVNEAKIALLDAVKDYEDMYLSQGMTIPDEIQDMEFEYKYDIASFFECFKWINVTQFAKRAGINDSLMRQYKKRLAFASEEQCHKIQKTIHNLADELSAVRL